MLVVPGSHFPPTCAPDIDVPVEAGNGAADFTAKLEIDTWCRCVPIDFFCRRLSLQVVGYFLIRIPSQVVIRVSGACTINPLVKRVIRSAVNAPFFDQLHQSAYRPELFD